MDLRNAWGMHGLKECMVWQKIGLDGGMALENAWFGEKDGLEGCMDLENAGLEMNALEGCMA